MVSQTILYDAKIALHGLVSENIIVGTPQTDFEKRIDEVFTKFSESPRSVSEEEVEAVVRHKDSQIGAPEDYWSHCVNVGRIFDSAVKQLQRKYSGGLRLPHPDDARAYGTIHDITATFSDWSTGRQHTKELDLYFVAKARGFDNIADEVALHADYLGIARLMAEGKPFPNQEAYAGMIEILKGEGPLSYGVIERGFSAFLAGEDNLPLLTLTVMDLIENGQDVFDPGAIDANYKARFTDGFLVRYTTGDSIAQMKPFGQALLDGGTDRMDKYLQILKDIALGDPVEIKERYHHTTFFRA